MNLAPKRTAILAYATLLAASVYGLIGGTAGLAGQAPAAVAPHVPVPISVNSVMVSLVDQAAHEIWDGGNRARPPTAREWLLIEQHALQLAAAGSVVSLGGTGQADRGWAQSPVWQDWSRKMIAVALQAKQSSDTKNHAALRTAGNALSDTCDGCHKVFKPAVPTEGIMHQPHYH